MARGGGEGNEQVYMCCGQTQCNDSFLYLHDFHKFVLIEIKRFF